MATALDEVRQSWLRWASQAYDNQREDYERYENYYDGDHELEFATDRWIQTFGTVFEQFADNWCQVVVDSVAQRMEIRGWRVDDEVNSELADEAEEIWDEGHVELEAVDLHVQTFVKGDGYLIVWPSDEAPGVDVMFHDALDVNVFYDPADRRRIARATKRWMTEDGDLRLNIYLPDRIEQYTIASRGLKPELLLSGVQAVPDDVLPEGWERMEDIPNPYGIVPVFHFKNKTRGSTHGISEIKQVIPIQNAVNKLLMDMMIASEFGAFRQKWMAGGGHPKDGWKAGPERVWATTDPNARFGTFQATDIEPYTRVVDTMVTHIAKVTQTPMHYLRVSGDMPSGEALKTAESGLVYKARDRQKTWGHTWAHAMTFALAIKRGAKSHDEIMTALGKRVTPGWVEPQSRHILEQAQTAQLKSILGVPLEQLWGEHFDYTEEQIDAFKEQNAVMAAQVMAQVIAQAGQLPPGLAEQSGLADVPGMQALLDAAAKGDLQAMLRAIEGLNIPQVLALLPKSITSKSSAGEATVKPQPNTKPPGSPTRRSTGFRDY